jgi:hypothetical protein
MSYEQRQSISSPTSLLLVEQNGRRTNLNVVVMTNYEQNTDKDGKGEYRPTTGTDPNLGTGGKIPRSFIYQEVPRNDPRYINQQGNFSGKLIGIDYTYKSDSGKEYLLIGWMGQDGKMNPTLNAGAAVENNFANYNQGQPGSDFTKNALATGQNWTKQDATEYARSEGLIASPEEGSGTLGFGGTSGEVAPGYSGLNRGTAEFQQEQREKAALALSEGESDSDGSSPAESPTKGLTLGSKDPIKVTKNKGVLGFENSINGQLRYPLEIVDASTDYLLIGIKEYVPIGGALIRPRGQFNGQQGTAKQKGTIILPIPSNIQDGNSVKYADGNLDGLTAAVAEYSLGVMTAGGSDDPIKEIQALTANSADKIFGQGSDLANVFTKSLAASAANLAGITPITRDQLLARESGGILNPNTELLFSGVSLRTFRFSFKLTPRNENEAIQIKSIIRTLKVNMAPKTATSKNFLSTPNVFDLTYMSGASPHPFLHSFKTCALTDMSVNYTGDGLYATYGGKEKSPISMTMDLTFRELEAIYDEDYEGNITGVGY